MRLSSKSGGFMSQCIVIADEITGGSSVGAMLQKNRCTVCSLMSAPGLKDQACRKFDCLVYSTNSRRLTPEQSYQMVFYAARLLKSDEVKVYAKRIDPAMRGNTCAETQAMLDALGDPERVAIVVPAFPALKRTNVGGYMMIDGRPLQKSLASIDDLEPAKSGRVADLFIEKFRYKSEALHLKEYIKGTEYLAARISELASNGTRALVMDCTSQEEINMIADAVIASGIKFLAVDPGPFTATLARKVMRVSRERVSRKTKIFGLVGISTPLAAAQVEVLRLEERVLIIAVRKAELLSDDLQRRAAEINRVVDEIVTKFDDYNTAFAVSDNMNVATQDQADFGDPIPGGARSEADELEIMSGAYGQIASKVLERRPEIGAVYSAGAEFTVAICRELKSEGLKILGQVMPLTAYGELLSGTRNNLKFVTSASSATDANTITESVQYLKRKLET